MFSVSLKNHTLRLPIIQGGMGVGISLSRLASAAINNGCMGIISAAHPGYREPDFYTNNFKANLRGLNQEVEKTRENTNHQGILGVNVMVASKRFKDYIKEISKMDIDALICGAGLPLDLPELVENPNIMLAPIVSSAKAAYLICRRWDSRYKKVPDFIVVEGAKAGGHLGFKHADLINNTTQSLEEILSEVLEVIQPYIQQYNRDIPVFVAGGIVSGKDIAYYMKRGAAGVQMGSRFIATYECDADDKFKQEVINCTLEDIGFTKSPSKLHGRAIKTAFMKEVNARSENVKIDRCVACLATCNPMDTEYCITDALIQSVKGYVDDGIVFVGESAASITKMTSVKQLVEELSKELSEAYEA
jgi:nitronate monooxygenase